MQNQGLFVCLPFATPVYYFMVYLYLFSCSYMLNFAVLPDFVFLPTTIFVTSSRDIFASVELRELKMILSILRCFFRELVRGCASHRIFENH